MQKKKLKKHEMSYTIFTDDDPLFDDVESFTMFDVT